jgi:hypothetical protein
MRTFQLVLVVCLAAIMARPAAGEVSSSDITDCEQSESGDTCASKTVVTVPVSYGIRQKLEIHLLGDPPPAPIAVEVKKNAPTFVYPLLYHHTVPYYPPTDQPYDEFALLFDAFEVERPSLEYKVFVKMTQGSPVVEFELRPNKPFYNEVTWQEDNGMPAPFEFDGALAGDSSPVLARPDLENFFVYIPSSPDTHPYVQSWHRYMLLVPREEVSYEGTECHKVGYVSRTRRGQARRICLNNQLSDKLEADIELINTEPTRETKYLVRGKRIFARSMDWSGSLANLKTLAYKAQDQIWNTRVALAVGTHPATIKRKTVISAGIIEDAFVQGVASHSRDITLVVDIENTGTLRADYVVTVTDCNFSIDQSIPPQARTLTPGETPETLEFDIYTRLNLNTTNYCVVELRSSDRRHAHDARMVFFDTEQVARDLIAPCWMYPPNTECRFARPLYD